MLEGLVFICLKGQYLVFNKCSLRLTAKMLASLALCFPALAFSFPPSCFSRRVFPLGLGLGTDLGKGPGVGGRFPARTKQGPLGGLGGHEALSTADGGPALALAFLGEGLGVPFSQCIDFEIFCWPRMSPPGGGGSAGFQ